MNDKLDPKKEIVCVIPQLYTFGEPINQIFWLRNIFYKHQNISIITYPLQKLRINRAVYNIITRGLNVIHTTDNEIIWFFIDKQKQPKIIEDKESIYIGFSNIQLLQLFFLKYQNSSSLKFHYSLTQNEYNMGMKLRKKFGIPIDAAIVTINVREAGWFNEYRAADDSKDPKNADIETYFPAISFIIDKGYYVVRLGDKNMRPLTNVSPQLIDAPFHPDYTDLADPYFIASSVFFIGTASGPFVLADSFGIPKIATNMPILETAWAWENDLYIFKKYYSKQLKRNLSFEEILLLPVPFHTSELEKLNLELTNNTSEEILAATKEMLLKIEKKLHYDKYDYLNNHFLKIQAKARKLKPNLNKDLYYVPLYNFFNTHFFPISIEFLKRNPDLIGHNTLLLQKIEPLI